MKVARDGDVHRCVDAAVLELQWREQLWLAAGDVAGVELCLPQCPDRRATTMSRRKKGTATSLRFRCFLLGTRRDQSL